MTDTAVAKPAPSGDGAAHGHPSTAGQRAPLVVHVVHRFATGGLENGVVNLINHMPADAWRHAVVALTEVTDFRHRLRRDDVDCFALHKPAGHGARVYPALWRLLRDLRPAVVHTRNLGALEMQVVAWAAGVPVRLHGEHGRDINDPDGTSRKHQRLRRLYAPFVHRWVALSQDLADYLTGPVGIKPDRVVQVYNGVDADQFHPSNPRTRRLAGCPFDPATHWIVGTVGRMSPIKHQTLLAQAFVLALQMAPALRSKLRLALVGDGPLLETCRAILVEAGAEALAWFPGERHDVADVMRGLSAFALPSLGEGISNTILEAMASGLPVVATAVGGNTELVVDGRTGWLVPSNDKQALANAILKLALHPAEAVSMGRAGRLEVERRFSLPAMIDAYQRLYQEQPARYRA